jgi:hypothetical protein
MIALTSGRPRPGALMRPAADQLCSTALEHAVEICRRDADAGIATVTISPISGSNRLAIVTWPPAR